jgi:hypothetical protein
MTTTEQINSMLETVEEMLDQLRDARAHAAGLRDEKRKMIEEVQATAAYRALDDAQTEADQTIEHLDQTIREMSLGMYLADEQTPERVTVKNWKVVEFLDVPALREWCFTNYRPVLTMDMKALEKDAKDPKKSIPFVKVVDEPRVSIATKL